MKNYWYQALERPDGFGDAKQKGPAPRGECCTVLNYQAYKSPLQTSDSLVRKIWKYLKNCHEIHGFRNITITCFVKISPKSDHGRSPQSNHFRRCSRTPFLATKRTRTTENKSKLVSPSLISMLEMLMQLVPAFMVPFGRSNPYCWPTPILSFDWNYELIHVGTYRKFWSRKF